MKAGDAASGVICPGEYYRLDEFARRCGMTVRTLREKYVNTELLRVSRLAKGSEMVPYSEAARFLEEMLGCDIAE